MEAIGKQKTHGVTLDEDGEEYLKIENLNLKDNDVHY